MSDTRCICGSFHRLADVTVANRALRGRDDYDPITKLDYADDGEQHDPLRFRRAAKPLTARLFAKLVHQATIHQVLKHQEDATNTTLTRITRREMVLRARQGAT